MQEYIYFKYFKGIDITVVYADDVGLDYEIDWQCVGYMDATFVRATFVRDQVK